MIPVSVRSDARLAAIKRSNDELLRRAPQPSRTQPRPPRQPATPRPRCRRPDRRISHRATIATAPMIRPSATGAPPDPQAPASATTLPPRSPTITIRLHAPNSRSTRRKPPNPRWCPPHPPARPRRARNNISTPQTLRYTTLPGDSRLGESAHGRNAGSGTSGPRLTLPWHGGQKRAAPRCFRSEVPEIALGGSVVNSGGSTTTYVPQPERGRATSTLRTSLGPCR